MSSDISPPQAKPIGRQAGIASRHGLTKEQLGMGAIAKWAPVLALIVLVIAGLLASPTFLSQGNVRTLLLSSTILMILAVGQTFVISTGGIDLSIAAVAQFSGIVMGLTFAAGAPIGVSILAALAAGTAAGVLNGFIVAKGRITDFIVTLGSFSILSGLTLLISNAKPQTVNSPLLTRISTGGIGILSFMILIAIIVAILGRVLLFNTAFGTHVLAVGGNKKAADAMGISFTKVKIGVYMVSGFLAAVGGILLAARLGAAEPTAGSAYQLTSIASVVLGGVSLFGGKSNIIGPLVGAVVLTGVVNLLNITGVPVYYQPVAVGAVVILAAFLRRYEK
ncbi:ABC transporter permease [Arthrobacter sp. ISL-5]|uniref:ABC transporter permease n=1 Tax=Arthrobacter sp. ISL-5 TaxID=2819111 RepID=UPI001BE9C3A4|nr:ABC transporter permease [Arthrobacter sp. ISL-5]MBT2555283.1 ABC transporter permease [Arthrobacter sp. ISL-5]